MLTGTAIILAGGKSSRMGFDKQELIVENKLSAIYIGDHLINDFDEIIIVTNKPYLYTGTGFTIVSDIVKNMGPLGGLHAGLMNSKSKFAYLIACDMPNINLDYIRYMKGLINTDPRPDSFDALITKDLGDMLEPFNGFYSTSTIHNLEKLFAVNALRVQGVFQNIVTKFIPEKKARTFSRDWRMFHNLNTKDDLLKYSG